MESIINGILDNPEVSETTKNTDSSFLKPDFGSDIEYSEDHEINDSIAALIRRSLPKLQIIGVGGAGNNAAARLMRSETMEDAEVLAINTDAQDLLNTVAHKKILIGYQITQGFGAGNDPSIGEQAAYESTEELKELITGDLVFITCGLGGGTGTGAAAVVAEIAKQKGALTVSICTLPFNMEGPVRQRNSLKGLKKLYNASDTVIIIPNQKLLSLSPDLSLVQGFKIADEVLTRAVTGISELITKPQMVNLDFADVKKILGNGGIAMIGLGESRGQTLSVKEAVDDALNNPLLTDLNLKTARKALICVGGGEDLSLKDAEDIVGQIQNRIDEDAEIIWGASVGPEMENSLRVIAIISDIDSNFTKKGMFDLNNGAEDIANGLKPSNDLEDTSENQNASSSQKKKKKRFGIF